MKKMLMLLLVFAALADAAWGQEKSVIEEISWIFDAGGWSIERVEKSVGAAIEMFSSYDPVEGHSINVPRYTADYYYQYTFTSGSRALSKIEIKITPLDKSAKELNMEIKQYIKTRFKMKEFSKNIPITNLKDFQIYNKDNAVVVILKYR
jgi:hypothetical protein